MNINFHIEDLQNEVVRLKTQINSWSDLCGYQQAILDQKEMMIRRLSVKLEKVTYERDYRL